MVLGLLTNTYLLPRLSPAVTQQLNAATPVLSGEWLTNTQVGSSKDERHTTVPFHADFVRSSIAGLLVAAICGKVVSANAAAVAQAGLPLLLAVVSLHVFGFLFGCVGGWVGGCRHSVRLRVWVGRGWGRGVGCTTEEDPMNDRAMIVEPFPPYVSRRRAPARRSNQVCGGARAGLLAQDSQDREHRDGHAEQVREESTHSASDPLPPSDHSNHFHLIPSLNSALAVVLARNSLPHPLSGLPGVRASALLL